MLALNLVSWQGNAMAAKKKKPSKATAKKKVEKKPVEPERPSRSYGKGEVDTEEVVGLFADEIQETYAVFGHTLDRTNAVDKATLLLRPLRYEGGGVRIVEKDFKVPLCRRHKED